jgi:hypothetical protein
MNKRKLILLGIGIFLAGALAGGAGMAFFAKARLSPLARMDKAGPAGFFLERMDYALKLSSEQKESIRPIIEDVLARIREIREPCLVGEEQALKDGAARIRTVLEPGQQEKFTAFMEKAKERRKKFYGH